MSKEGGREDIQKGRHASRKKRRQGRIDLKTNNRRVRHSIQPVHRSISARQCGSREWGARIRNGPLIFRSRTSDCVRVRRGITQEGSHLSLALCFLPLTGPAQDPGVRGTQQTRTPSAYCPLLSSSSSSSCSSSSIFLFSYSCSLLLLLLPLVTA